MTIDYRGAITARFILVGVYKPLCVKDFTL